MTTSSNTRSRADKLWFAQNSLPLWLKWQLTHEDLHQFWVVICSKFITFVVEMTTRPSRSVAGTLLWFAQNSLPLWLKWQPALIVIFAQPSCDLLKIHYLCGWNDNFCVISWQIKHVVICSKFITFVVEMTTAFRSSNALHALWFAQNSLPLWLKWQLEGLCRTARYCCDLLKIHYLCGWNDNAAVVEGFQPTVVICSKFITFVVEMTTISGNWGNKWGLWFAQNSLPLWLKWQLARLQKPCASSCDLLKIHYLCGWNDNDRMTVEPVTGVVICSKFITFVVEMTTFSFYLFLFRALWFAQNSLPLWLKWQQYADQLL